MGKYDHEEVDDESVYEWFDPHDVRKEVIDLRWRLECARRDSMSAFEDGRSRGVAAVLERDGTLKRTLADAIGCRSQWIADAFVHEMYRVGLISGTSLMEIGRVEEQVRGRLEEALSTVMSSLTPQLQQTVSTDRVRGDVVICATVLPFRVDVSVNLKGDLGPASDSFSRTSEFQRVQRPELDVARALREVRGYD